MNADEIKAALGLEPPNGPTAPAAVVERLAEEVDSKWLLEILGLPATADVGFPTDGALH